MCASLNPELERSYTVFSKNKMNVSHPVSLLVFVT